MNNWYPVLEQLDEVNTPETVQVPLEEAEGSDVPHAWDNDEVREAVEEVDGTPAFVRTDAASNKHFMHKSSRLPDLDEDTIDSHISEVLFHCASAGWAGLPFDRLYIREWLDLAHEFKAFGQTPIAQEIRFFIHNGQVLNSHFYWPKDSIKFFSHADTEEPDNWEELWEKTRTDALENIEGALRQAEIVADTFRGQGFWSLDFARTETGEWYAIDMARGEISWHPRVDEVESHATKVSAYENLYDLSTGVREKNEEVKHGG